MSIPVVNTFVRKIAEAHLVKGMPKIKKTLEACFLELKNYIDSTIDEYLGSEVYDDKTISLWIYKDHKTVSLTDQEKFVKINLYAGKQTLGRITSDIESSKEGLTYDNIFLYRNILKEFLVDIKFFIEFYRRKADPKFVFYTAAKSYFTTSFETIMVARGLFYNSLLKENSLPYKESQGMVGMVIRQSIEVKTKRLLGIYEIKKLKAKSFYSFKKLFDFIEINKSDIIYDPIDFEILKQVYSWSCTYIHNAELGYIWQNEIALSYLLRSFFAPGSHGSTRSIFGAFKINSFEAVKSRLEKFVGKSEYSISFVPDHMVEAMILSK